ncbi:ornithine decarboxylase [Agaricus bisporus var. bisporus H97]|uniref:ornithine decarboxylase n=1 Tax=Agaricus bisporus var. bisporus (strain H97 / ATCC MYA-4626 / FGSC 10389) TaxID=936046 RepID=UPI00029F56CA|nr:ornithine decarboxylase [Agaricus bisporus var. bisporus H97]EKV51888.1 ornithine decarboxylase [Agaricus bisporus var. bisporus H97]
MIELAYAHDSPLLPLCRLPNYTQNLCKNQPDPIADPIPNDDVLFPFDQPWGEDVFPDLPPLFRGRPDVHLRNGILNARVLASSGVPDAEKAFFVGDLSVVYKQHMRWTRCLPDIQPFYAVKCNPDPYILRLLAALGAGFDCASNGEINNILSIGGGIDPSRIIFANPCKATSFIRAAARTGVDTMTFDNADELYKIAKAHPRAKLVIRILTDDSKSLCAFGIKFGASLSVVPSLLAKAKELNLDVIGVSFHVGSGCYDPSIYRDAISRARAVFNMGRDVGYAFTLLDVGGGFEDRLFETAAQVITTAINEFFPEDERRQKGINLIAEPGRFYVSTAFRLAVNVIARRAPLDGRKAATPPPGEEQPEVMYYINDGVYGAFNCILFDHQTPQPHVLTLQGNTYTSSSPSHQQLASIWGPTCDSIDCVSKGVMLPYGIQVGDWFGFENMGAYTVCAASQFNGFDVSKVIYTVGGGSEEDVVVGEDIIAALTDFAQRV